MSKDDFEEIAGPSFLDDDDEMKAPEEEADEFEKNEKELEAKDNIGENSHIDEEYAEKLDAEDEEVPTNIKRVKFTKWLKYYFTPEELRTYSNDMANVMGQLEQKKLDIKAVVGQLKAELSEMEARVAMLAGKVRNKSESKNVECESTLDYTTGTKDTVRMDTGELIEEDVPLNSGEKQKDLPAVGDEV